MAGLNWLKVDASIFEHPKTRRLARALGITPEQTVGHLIRLWSWALRISPDGVLKNADEIDIAEAANFDGDAELFVRSLLSCSNSGIGFLEKTEEGYFAFHDWDEYSGALEQKREKNRDRMREARKKKNENESEVSHARANVQAQNGNVCARATHKSAQDENVCARATMCTLREEERREEKNREEDKKHSSDSEENQSVWTREFERLWSVYPRKEGKTAALRGYIEHRRSGVSFEEIAAGLKNYIARLKAECTEARFIKAGNTFFGPAAAWKDFLTAAPPGAYGGMMEPQTPQQFEDEREFINANFGGDTNAYAKWLSAGSPKPAGEWFRHYAERVHRKRDS